MKLNICYIKIQHLNKQLLKLHLPVANSWKNSWPYIQNKIEEKNNVVPRLVFLISFINITFKLNGDGVLKNY